MHWHVRCIRTSIQFHILSTSYQLYDDHQPASLTEWHSDSASETDENNGDKNYTAQPLISVILTSEQCNYKGHRFFLSLLLLLCILYMLYTNRHCITQNMIDTLLRRWISQPWAVLHHTGKRAVFLQRYVDQSMRYACNMNTHFW